MKTKGKTVESDWRQETNEKEKYSKYLASREWSVKKEAVRKRSNGLCERCGIVPMAACHHLTYARKYDEDLDDLQAICTECHDFTHSKSTFDPLRHKNLLRLLSIEHLSDARSLPDEFFVTPFLWIGKDWRLMNGLLAWCFVAKMRNAAKETWDICCDEYQIKESEDDMDCPSYEPLGEEMDICHHIEDVFSKFVMAWIYHDAPTVDCEQDMSIAWKIIDRIQAKKDQK